MSEEQTTPATEQNQQQLPDLPKVLAGRPNAPSQQQIDLWKNQFGDVMVSGFSEEELYIWRALNRQEYKQLQSSLHDPASGWDEHRYEEEVCTKCILWPKVDDSFFKKAGTASVISEQVFMHSNFMAPAAASMLVAKL